MVKTNYHVLLHLCLWKYFFVDGVKLLLTKGPGLVLSIVNKHFRWGLYQIDSRIVIVRRERDG